MVGQARFRWMAITVASMLAPPGSSASAERLRGMIHDDQGPVVGAMVTLQVGDPARAWTVYSDEAGAFLTPEIASPEVSLRVRRIGWRDLRREKVAVASEPLALVLERETDDAALAAQLPAHRWFQLLTQEITDETEREQFIRQCTYCHQQGNRATRIPREDWQWEKVLSLMARMGGVLPAELRAKVPDLFRRAYDPATAVPALTANRDSPDFAPPAEPEARRAVIDEWELGLRASMQHDLIFHPDGRAYSVDMAQDNLYRLDPETGQTDSFPLADDGLPLGGVLGGRDTPLSSTANSRQGPHSLQVGPDGDVWTTMALGNQIGRFDVETETWKTYPLDAGYYPHTLRLDGEGRVWFTIAGSNHVGMFDPATEEFTTLMLPARTYGQALFLRLLPAILWLAEAAGSPPTAGESGDPDMMPVPYGIDVAADGAIWFSQLNQHRIGRIHPDSFDIEVIDTPFPAPRRLRFDRGNGLWIPSFSTGRLARFDVETREFKEWTLPTSREGTETPYALHINRQNDEVWVCGTNSDTLIRFQPATERFTVYPLPTRVTYTRDIDFDPQGRVWTSNSNAPTWQVEGGFPRVLRLDPNPRAADVAQELPSADLP